MTGNGNGNGHGRAQDGRVRVAIVGVGNCASSLVQGVHYYRNAKPGDRIPGIMHVDLGGYHINDVDFVAAIDVDLAIAEDADNVVGRAGRLLHDL